jgi:hypothetical protein
MKEDVYKRTKKSLLLALIVFLFGVATLPLIDYVMKMDVMQSLFGPLLFAPFLLSMMLLPFALMLGAMIWVVLILLRTRKEIILVDTQQAKKVPSSELKAVKMRNNKLLTIMFVAFVLLFVYSFLVGFLEQGS